MKSASKPDRATKSNRVRNAAIFFICIVIWLIVDQSTKAYFDSPDFVGGTFVPGILDFSLVHNTGGAWGVFSDSTALLGWFSLIVCALVAIYLFVLAPNTPVIGAIGLSLVFAGGIGNVIDRFSHAYVIDFIKTTFIDFPVFNVADIGVTCGIALFLISLIIEWAHSSKRQPVDTEKQATGKGE